MLIFGLLLYSGLFFKISNFRINNNVMKGYDEYFDN